MKLMRKRMPSCMTHTGSSRCGVDMTSPLPRKMAIYMPGLAAPLCKQTSLDLGVDSPGPTAGRMLGSLGNSTLAIL